MQLSQNPNAGIDPIHNKMLVFSIWCVQRVLTTNMIWVFFPDNLTHFLFAFVNVIETQHIDFPKQNALS